MNIKIAIKSASKTRGVECVDYTIKDDLITARELIENLVDIEIDKYENRAFEIRSQDDISRMLESGKVSFGFKYREDDIIDRREAKEVATVAFYDGLYALFVGDNKIEGLADRVNLKEDDVITLIRFTMLAGRYF